MTITSSMMTMLPAIRGFLVKEWKVSVHCAKSPDLKPTENFWADIKPDLYTERNVPGFEIAIHDILNIRFPPRVFSNWPSQCLVGVVAIPATMLLFVII